MDNTVDAMIPVDVEAAKALESPARRKAVGRYLSSLLKGERARDALAEAIAEAKREARAHGLTDQEIDAELDEWRAERRADRRHRRVDLRLRCPQSKQPPGASPVARRRSTQPADPLAGGRGRVP